MSEISDRIIEYFHLEPLRVEGGYYTQTYRSPEDLEREALPERYGDARPVGTAILYLLDGQADCFSALHRLPTDEIYHFYLGDPVEMLLLFPDGSARRAILGQDVLAGQQVQFVAPHDAWQGSHLVAGGGYALLGTTMAPGYADADYIGGEREDLVRKYPAEADLIRRLTRIPGKSE